MKRAFKILSIADEPVFETAAEAADHAQHLANEEGESVWYETEIGESECVPEPRNVLIEREILAIEER